MPLQPAQEEVELEIAEQIGNGKDLLDEQVIQPVEKHVQEVADAANKIKEELSEKVNEGLDYLKDLLKFSP